MSFEHNQPALDFHPWTGSKLDAQWCNPTTWRHAGSGARRAWDFNPWTGQPRDSRDVESDPFGYAIWMLAWGDMPAAHPRGISHEDAARPAPRAADGVIDKAVQYNAGGVECIDAIQAALTPEEYRGFLKGNVIKYTWREKHKGGEESLKKAQWYLARLLALALALGGVSGCGSDYASPFDKPDETVQPVTCSASTPCAQ